MASLRGPGMRGVSSDPQSVVSLLESDEPLPDDDPSTRRGGLDPRRQADLNQISTYAQLRQTGAISDKAWQRLIERNPRSAVLFSSINPSQDVTLARSRAQIGQQYFQPDQQIISGPEDDQMVRFKPGKADIENAYRAAMAAGDIQYANQILAGNKEPPEKNINSYNLALRAEGRTTGDPRVDVLDPKTAANALARTMPPSVVPTTGGSIVAPRGQVPGEPGALPNFVPNPTNLSGPDIERLSDVTATAEQSKKLLAGFKDEFGGYKSSLLGEAVTAYKSRFGDDSGISAWWNEYQSKKNVQRNKLFGGALTDTERKEWEKADINPGMTPELIKKNLARRAALEQRAAAKITKAYQSGSYNKSQIDAATGSTEPEAPKKRIKFSELP